MNANWFTWWMLTGSPGEIVSRHKWPRFKLDIDIVKINNLAKFQEWAINMTLSVVTRFLKKFTWWNVLGNTWQRFKLSLDIVKINTQTEFYWHWFNKKYVTNTDAPTTHVWTWTKPLCWKYRQRSKCCIKSSHAKIISFTSYLQLNCKSLSKIHPVNMFEIKTQDSGWADKCKA